MVIFAELSSGYSQTETPIDSSHLMELESRDEPYAKSFGNTTAIW